jgi:hypothetical protein
LDVFPTTVLAVTLRAGIENGRATVAMLGVPASSYVTGQCVAVDGGFLQHGF